MQKISHVHKAWGVTVVFALLGVYGLFFHGAEWSMALPNAIFYAVLVANSFFSIHFFVPLTPVFRIQNIIDAALVLIYAALALSIGSPVAFAFFALAVFVVAPVKYAQMLLHTQHDAILKRKILIDLAGTALCAALLGTTLLGFAAASAWALAISFALANVYLLLINPMYRLS